jgi:hypothetical protein
MILPSTINIFTAQRPARTEMERSGAKDYPTNTKIFAALRLPGGAASAKAVSAPFIIFNRYP